MLGSVTFYKRDSHEIIHGGDLAEFIQRTIKEADPRRKLFLVHYNRWNTFCICEWMVPNETFVDVMNLGGSLANFDRKRADELRHRLFAPLRADETSKVLEQNESNYNHMMNDDNEEEAERLAKCAMGE